MKIRGHFTVSWFKDHVPMWSRHLLPLRDQPLRYLEIGMYEGMSAYWMCRNVLTHPYSSMIGIDPWQQDNLKRDRTEELQRAEERCRINLAQFGNKAEIVKAKSSWVFGSPLAPRHLRLARFDIAYIDGDHTLCESCADTLMVWQRVKPGGIVIWDDYVMKSRRIMGCRRAVSAFLDAIGPEKYDLLWKTSQIAIRKLV